MQVVREKHPSHKYIFYVLSGLVIAFGIAVLVVGSLLAFTPKLYIEWAKEPATIFNKYFKINVQPELNEKDVGGFVLEYTKHIGVPLFTLGIVKISLAIYGIAVVVVGTRSNFTHDLLWVYFINTIFSTLLEAGALFILVFQSEKIRMFMEGEMKNATDWYLGPHTDVNPETRMWDIIHLKYNCCGVSTCASFKDKGVWRKKYPSLNNDSIKLTCPPTCCHVPLPGLDDNNESIKLERIYTLESCLRNPNYNNSYASKGCKYSVHDEVKRMISILFILWVISFVLSMMCMYLAMGISGFLAEKYLFETTRDANPQVVNPD